ncbi:MAG: hypothetical protein MRJ93_01635 [Nitrososphaeraceae archaeon]|nr:hypothetical protein [Nitrososphaeraceae archaeon]
MNKIKFNWHKNSSFIVLYSLYLYFLGLSLRNTSKALIIFGDDKMCLLLFGNGYQCLQLNHTKLRKRLTAYTMDETIIPIYY